MTYSQIATTGTIAAGGTVVVAHTLGTAPDWVGYECIDNSSISTSGVETVSKATDSIIVKNISAAGIMENVSCFMLLRHSLIS